MPHEVTYWKPEGSVSETQHLVGEAPLSILVQGQPFYTGMRTPGEEIAHAAGFCLAEGLAEFAEDIVSIRYADESNPHLVQVTLSPARWEKYLPHSRKNKTISPGSVKARKRLHNL